MATGLQAWKLAKGLYIVPLLFLYSPLINGNWIDILGTTLFALAGLFAVSAAFQSHLSGPLNLIERCLLIAIALLLLLPVFLVAKLGALVVLIGFIFKIQYDQQPNSHTNNTDR